MSIACYLQHAWLEVELFKRLPRDELPALAKAAVEVSYPKGKVIITQNDEGHEFFVIKKGSAGATSRNTHTETEENKMNEYNNNSNSNSNSINIVCICIWSLMCELHRCRLELSP